MINRDEALNILINADGGVSSKLPTATLDEIYQAELTMKKIIPDSLRDFYTSYSNGIIFGRLKILPVFSKSNQKRTGDSISRNNMVEHSPMYFCEQETIEQLTVFCLGEWGIYFCFHAEGGDTVWQWESVPRRLKKLEYDFWGWLLACLHHEQNYLFS